VSSTDGGNGTLTINSSGLSSLSINLSHNHNRIISSGRYVWSGNQVPSNLPSGVTTSFASKSEGFPEYGSVLNVSGLSGQDGGAFQLYAPYSKTYGGDRMKYRTGKYNNEGWTDWKEILDVDHANTLYDKYEYWTINGLNINS